MNTPPKIILNFFDWVEQAGIRYCLWKSNQHLLEALTGKTDMDLLIDRSQAARIKPILQKAGFKQFISQPWARHPGLEDWIGFDYGTGILVHLHLHYQMVLGKRFVKEYHLPWEDTVLTTAIKDPAFQVFITDPNLEILILAIRIGTKTEAKAILSGFTGKNPIHPNLWNEFNYLYEQVDAASVKAYAVELLGNIHGRELASLLNPGDIRKPTSILRIRAIVNRSLADHRHLGNLGIWGTKISHWFQYLFSKAQKRLNVHLSQVGKRRQSEGVIVAIIGCDGSGKSTLSKDIQQWLSWKIDAKNIYMGSGQGSVGFLVKGLKRLASMTASRSQNGNQEMRKTASSIQNGKPSPSLIRELGSCILGLSLADERYRKVMDAEKYRYMGTILITDRYPQNQFAGIYDGPRISRDAGDQGVRGFFASLEDKKYQKISEISPDVVIKLHLPLEVALQRKPDHSVENIQKKAEITRELKFKNSKVVDLDTSEPYEDVLRSVKQIVWESL